MATRHPIEYQVSPDEIDRGLHWLTLKLKNVALAHAQTGERGRRATNWFGCATSLDGRLQHRWGRGGKLRGIPRAR